MRSRGIGRRFRNLKGQTRPGWFAGLDDCAWFKKLPLTLPIAMVADIAPISTPIRASVLTSMRSMVARSVRSGSAGLLDGRVQLRPGLASHIVDIFNIPH